MTSLDVEGGTVVFSMGDPNGIGPEVLLKALASYGRELPFHAVLVGAPDYLNSFARSLGFSPQEHQITFVSAGEYPFPPPWGQLSDSAGRLAGNSLLQAVEYCQEHRLPLLVTAPVSKKALHEAGFKFPGQTEMIASAFPSVRPAMAFFSDRLHVALATVHIALRDVFRSLTPDLLAHRARLFHQALKWLGIRRPRIAMCGLNPHASEEGLMGDEEATLIGPTVDELREDGMSGLSGPYPPDTVFRRALDGEFDGVIALYHDQGLIPVKLAAFDSAVNTTLGLPLLRTSPDHGTAFDLAGRNLADPSSMISALHYGMRLMEGFLASRNLSPP